MNISEFNIEQNPIETFGPLPPLSSNSDLETCAVGLHQGRDDPHKAAFPSVSPCFRFFLERSADLSVVHEKCVRHCKLCWHLPNCLWTFGCNVA